MANKPETTFYKAVHRAFGPNAPYYEKTSNLYRGGTPDIYYSGDIDDLWVEYKYLPRVPVRGVVKPKLSALQINWLDSRHKEGRNVAVIIGCPKGGIILVNNAWNQSITAPDFNRLIVSKQRIADWIRAKVGVSPCEHSNS